MNKQLLWNILERYDQDKNMIIFCNSLSKVIQNKYTENDIINIISVATIIDNIEIEMINSQVDLYEVVF